MPVMVAESSECVPCDVAARIVAAADRERRRLERDLHDGAQQRLVSLSMRLRLVAMRLAPGSEAERLLASAQDELAASLQELRELARGLHPAVLTEHGLAAALDSLAARAPLPVDLRVELTRRPSQAVEVAAYYVVSEALANVAKYADASTVTVRVGRHGTRLVVTVADDGVGGADPAAGSGLRGLADRVAAVGGRLRIASPPACGTTLRAELPLQDDSPSPLSAARDVVSQRPPDSVLESSTHDDHHRQARRSSSCPKTTPEAMCSPADDDAPSAGGRAPSCPPPSPTGGPKP